MNKLKTKLDFKTYEELKHDIDRISHILMDAVISNDCVSYLADIHFSERGLLLLKNSFLMYSYIYLGNLTVIELHKLLGNSKRDRYNINLFLNKFKPTGVYANAGIELSLIQSWELEIKKHKKFVAHISDLRNQNYAHTDKSTVPNMASIQETNEVVNLTKNIVTYIHHLVYDTNEELKHFIYPIGVPVNSLKRIVVNLLKDYHLEKNE